MGDLDGTLRSMVESAPRSGVFTAVLNVEEGDIEAVEKFFDELGWRARRVKDHGRPAVQGWPAFHINRPPRIVRYLKDRLKPRLVRPPASRLLSAAGWLLPPKDAEHIVGQAVADMREESFQALADGRQRKALWIEIRDTTRILLAIAQATWHRVGKFALGFFKIVS